MIKLELELNEVDFIANLLAAVTTGQTVQAGMTHLLQKIANQAQESMQRENAMAQEIAIGIEQAVS